MIIEKTGNFSLTAFDFQTDWTEDPRIHHKQ